MPLTKFESMLKTNSIYFLDLAEFEEIILHYLDTGKHTLAKKAIKLGLEQHPNAIDLKLLEVEILIFDNQLEKAARLIKKIQEIDPNNEEAYIQKAILLSKKGAHKQAILSLKDALIYVDDKADIWSLLGMEYLYMDDFKNARLNFEKCLDADFEDYAALYNIVYCFDMEKSHKQAIHYLNSYVDKNPYCEVAWHQLGCQYFMLKMFKEALTSFDFAVLIDEYFIGGYLEKAKTLEQLGCYNEAIENYLITLELDDPTVFAYMRVGECYDKLGTSDKAVNYYKKAVHEDPLLDKGWMLLAQSYFVNKDYQKSLYYVNRALKIDENNTIYWRKYAEINLQLNFFEAATNAYYKCLALKDENLAIFLGLSDALVFLGEFNDALKVLFLAYKKHKDIMEIEYRLAGLFFMLHKENHGIDHLKKGLTINYEYHSTVKELYPFVFENKKVRKLLADFKKR